MKKITLTFLQISLGVFSLILLLSSCTSDKSLLYNDYYQTRVVKRKASRNISMPAFRSWKIKKVDNITNPAIDEAYAEAKPATPRCQPGISELNSLPAVYIASTDYMLYVNPARERLTRKSETYPEPKLMLNHFAGVLKKSNGSRQPSSPYSQKRMIQKQMLIRRRLMED